MKALLKLAIFFLVVHALFRFVPPYWSHNQFASELKARALTWREHSVSDVREQVLAMATARGVPIDGEHITVRREQDHLLIDVAYTRTIEFVPGWTYPWAFEAHVDAWMIRPPFPIR